MLPRMPMVATRAPIIVAPGMATRAGANNSGAEDGNDTTTSGAEDGNETTDDGERIDGSQAKKSRKERSKNKARVMSTHASILVDSVGPPRAEVCRTAASFP